MFNSSNVELDLKKTSFFILIYFKQKKSPLNDKWLLQINFVILNESQSVFWKLRRIDLI